MNKLLFGIGYLLLLLTAVCGICCGIKHVATTALAILTSLVLSYAYFDYAKKLEIDEATILYGFSIITPISVIIGGIAYLLNATIFAYTLLGLMGLIIIPLHLMSMIIVGIKEKLPIWSFAAPWFITIGVLEPYVETVLGNVVVNPFLTLVLIGSILALIGLVVKK